MFGCACCARCGMRHGGSPQATAPAQRAARAGLEMRLRHQCWTLGSVDVELGRSDHEVRQCASETIMHALGERETARRIRQVELAGLVPVLHDRITVEQGNILLLRHGANIVQIRRRGQHGFHTRAVLQVHQHGVRARVPSRRLTPSSTALRKSSGWIARIASTVPVCQIDQIRLPFARPSPAAPPQPLPRSASAAGWSSPSPRRREAARAGSLRGAPDMPASRRPALAMLDEPEPTTSTSSFLLSLIAAATLSSVTSPVASRSAGTSQVFCSACAGALPASCAQAGAAAKRPATTTALRTALHDTPPEAPLAAREPLFSATPLYHASSHAAAHIRTIPATLITKCIQALPPNSRWRTGRQMPERCRRRRFPANAGRTGSSATARPISAPASPWG